MIHLKGMAAASPIVHKYAVCIQPYDIVIKYKPGMEVTLAE